MATCPLVWAPLSPLRTMNAPSCSRERMGSLIGPSMSRLTFRAKYPSRLRVNPNLELLVHTTSACPYNPTQFLPVAPLPPFPGTGGWTGWGLEGGGRKSHLNSYQRNSCPSSCPSTVKQLGPEGTFLPSSKAPPQNACLYP